MKVRDSARNTHLPSFPANVNLGSIVIVNLVSPPQCFVGRLLLIQPSGVTVRGVDLNAFEDWMNHVAAREDAGVHPTTTFFPLHRIEKMILDENAGAVPSFSRSFQDKVGRSIVDQLEES